MFFTPVLRPLSARSGFISTRAQRPHLIFARPMPAAGRCPASRRFSPGYHVAPLRGARSMSNHVLIVIVVVIACRHRSWTLNVERAPRRGATFQPGVKPREFGRNVFYPCLAAVEREVRFHLNSRSTASSHFRPSDTCGRALPCLPAILAGLSCCSPPGSSEHMSNHVLIVIVVIIACRGVVRHQADVDQLSISVDVRSWTFPPGADPPLAENVECSLRNSR